MIIIKALSVVPGQQLFHLFGGLIICLYIPLRNKIYFMKLVIFHVDLNITPIFWLSVNIGSHTLRSRSSPSYSILLLCNGFWRIIIWKDTTLKASNEIENRCMHSTVQNIGSILLEVRCMNIKWNRTVGAIVVPRLNQKWGFRVIITQKALYKYSRSLALLGKSWRPKRARK